MFKNYVRAYFVAVKQCINVVILRPNKTQNYDWVNIARLCSEGVDLKGGNQV